MVRQPMEQLKRRFDDLVQQFAGRHEGRSVVLRLGACCSGRRSTTERPGASVLKLPLVAAVHVAASREVLDLEEPLMVSDLPTSRFPSVFDVFAANHTFTIRELCGLALATSDNRAATKLLEVVGSAEVNRYLRSIGCLNSALRVGFGDRDLGARGRSNVTTAADCVRILERANDDPASMLGLASSVHSTRLSAGLPDDLVVRHKTGTLTGVVNDIGVVETAAGPLFGVFLCDGEASPRQAAHDIADCMRDAWLAVTTSGERGAGAS